MGAFESRRREAVRRQHAFILFGVELAILLKGGNAPDGVAQLFGRHDDAHLFCDLHPEPAFDELFDDKLLELIFGQFARHQLLVEPIGVLVGPLILIPADPVVADDDDRVFLVLLESPPAHRDDERHGDQDHETTIKPWPLDGAFADQLEHCGIINWACGGSNVNDATQSHVICFRGGLLLQSGGLRSGTMCR